jgi:hypothetical protein
MTRATKHTLSLIGMSPAQIQYDQAHELNRPTETVLSLATCSRIHRALQPKLEPCTSIAMTTTCAAV